jgi:hypothetical protein
MVYNIGGLVSVIGAGIQNDKLVRAVGNPMFPMIAISVLFLVILVILTGKSNIADRWKWFSIFAIATLSGVAGIIFLNKYMAKKIVVGSQFNGGTHQLPNPSFFNTAPIPVQVSDAPIASFDDLFATFD